jgi:hypothetical protein
MVERAKKTHHPNDDGQPYKQSEHEKRTRILSTTTPFRGRRSRERKKGRLGRNLKVIGFLVFRDAVGNRLANDFAENLEQLQSVERLPRIT